MSQSSKGASRPWYREPYMWLVVGGPLTVVVASLSTYGMAVRWPDPVLERDAAVEAQRVGKDLSAEARASLEPALKARDHVASPEK